MCLILWVIHYNIKGHNNEKGFIKPTQDWTVMDNALFERMTSGLLSALFATRRFPQIRYLAGSEVCQKVALKLTVFCLFEFRDIY